jgi:hypothetical protein
MEVDRKRGMYPGGSVFRKGKGFGPKAFKTSIYLAWVCVDCGRWTETLWPIRKIYTPFPSSGICGNPNCSSPNVELAGFRYPRAKERQEYFKQLRPGKDEYKRF